MSETPAPKPFERKKDVYCNVYMTKETRNRLKSLKKELGFRTYDAALNYTILEVTEGGVIPPADYEHVFRDTHPVIITGKSGSGKSTTVKNLLGQWTGNIFLLDAHHEYPDLESIDLGKFFGMKWQREGQRVRYLSNPNVSAAKGEASGIFQHLSFVKSSGELKEWVLVVEEGHRFSEDANLRALLIEARKFVRKLIVVTTDWKVYGEIADVYKPKPYDIIA